MTQVGREVDIGVTGGSEPVANGGPGPTQKGQTAGGLASKARFAYGIERWGLVLLLAATTLLFGVLPASSAHFVTLANFRNTASDLVVGGVLTLAALLPLTTGEFDFSIGLNLEMSAMVAAGVMARLHQSIPVAVVAAIGTGLLIGMVNGYLVAVRGLNSFIATFAVSTIVSGFVQLYASGSSILVPSNGLTSFGLISSRWLGVPEATWALMALYLLTWYVLDHTPLGRALYATGSNRSAATLTGLRVKHLTFGAFGASGVLAAIAGVLYVSQQASATPNVGQGYVLPAFAAVFLGATTIRLGHFNVWGTLVALVFVAVGTTGLVFSGIATWVQSVFQGVVLLVALALAVVLTRGRGAAASTQPKL